MSELDVKTLELLQQGLADLNLSSTYCEPFLQYLRLLQRWNQAYNLTAVRELNAMVSRHILDSLALLPWVHGTRFLDVGSGAGFPGIPLALARPELDIVLLDSNGKKTRFLEEVKRVLALKNVQVLQTRVEQYRPEQGFDSISSRAFGELAQLIHWTEPLLVSSGRWIAMKGRYPKEELVKLNYPYRVETYEVLGLDEQRCCVIIEKG